MSVSAPISFLGIGAPAALTTGNDVDKSETYRTRAEHLRTLGFSSYTLYLQSDLWYTIRRAVLKRDRHVCRCCMEARATQVHHLKYSARVLRGENIGWLISVCAGCHERSSVDEGIFLPLSESNRRLGFVGRSGGPRRSVVQKRARVKKIAPAPVRKKMKRWNPARNRKRAENYAKCQTLRS